MTRNSHKFNLNQQTNISIPVVEYISTDKRMWCSIKRRVEISDKIFDFKDIVLIFIGAVAGGWISYFSVDEKIKVEYKNRLTIFSVIGVLLGIFLFWVKYQKKEFTNTILADMSEIEN